MVTNKQKKDKVFAYNSFIAAVEYGELIWNFINIVDMQQGAIPSCYKYISSKDKYHYPETLHLKIRT